MNWLIDNWLLLLVLFVCVGMHFWGYGHGHKHAHSANEKGTHDSEHQANVSKKTE